uniref:non-muscle cofilin 1-like n=1 Tax=Semicossyphus pulcher TaxID=241346 RepID=UPI0037E83C08
MASGIKVADSAKAIFEKMKVVKADESEGERKRLVTFTINNDECIDVCKIINQEDLGKDGVPEDAFKAFGTLLCDDSCCYILYDCHYETQEGIKKEELIFGAWIPDTSGIKLKMKYASSKNAIKAMMKGLKHDLQMNDRADYICRDAFAACVEKNSPKIAKIEGVSVCGR